MFRKPYKKKILVAWQNHIASMNQIQIPNVKPNLMHVIIRFIGNMQNKQFNFNCLIGFKDDQEKSLQLITQCNSWRIRTFIQWIPLFFDIQTLKLAKNNKRHTNWERKNAKWIRKTILRTLQMDGQCTSESQIRMRTKALPSIARISYALTAATYTATLVQTIKWTIKLDLRGYKWPFILPSIVRFSCTFRMVNLCSLLSFFQCGDFALSTVCIRKRTIWWQSGRQVCKGSPKYHDIFIDCGLFAVCVFANLNIFIECVGECVFATDLLK